MHTRAEFDKILNRGKKLKHKMDEALGDDAWSALHGHQQIPKRYVPPFLQDQAKGAPKDFKAQEQERMDNLYSIEIDAALDRAKPKGQPQAQPAQNRVTFVQDEERQDPDVSQIQFGG